MKQTTPVPETSPEQSPADRRTIPAAGSVPPQNVAATTEPLPPQFLRRNIRSLLGMVSGLVAGYFYWLHWGIYDGTFGFSSEWWYSCLCGLLTGGLAGALTAGRRL
ncbi:MAG: hypothetical protein LBH72_04585 [Proteiniphilum sp.]|jgi:hypothetical protein|nr:hypothetical protein [Proteiniphilum sp.]